MNSLYRLLKILDVFHGGHAVVSVEQMSAHLGYTRSTLYRYLKVLTDKGLLTACDGNGFALGPRIVELNAQLHGTDPFLLAGRGAMTRLTSRHKGFALLCRRYRDQVLCVHSEAGTLAPPPPISAGHYCNVARHPQGRVIVARLPAAQVRRIHHVHAEDFGRAGLGHTPAALRLSFKDIRERGYDIERDLDGCGVGVISVPIFGAGNTVVGSLTLGTESERLTEPRIETLARRLDESAREISTTLVS